MSSPLSGEDWQKIAFLPQKTESEYARRVRRALIMALSGMPPYDRVFSGVALSFPNLDRLSQESWGVLNRILRDAQRRGLLQGAV